MKAPASETQILSAPEVSRWFRSATPGDRLVYCTGPAMLPGPTLDLLLALVRERKALTHKRRRPDNALEHILVVKRPPKAAPPPVEADPFIEKIFEALARAAERRRRCPSDAELARIAGLATRNQASWRVRKLIDSGRIRSETTCAPDGTKWRIVTIVATRARTAAAPPMRRAG